MKILMIFGVGISILLVAIILNFVANKLGLQTWYTFLKNPKYISLISTAWLFIIYPFIIGLVAYLFINLIK